MSTNWSRTWQPTSFDRSCWRLPKQYAERPIDEENEDRAIEVLEDGIETFRSTTDLRWLAAEGLPVIPGPSTDR
jgi:hypothetical protein